MHGEMPPSAPDSRSSDSPSDLPGREKHPPLKGEGRSAAGGPGWGVSGATNAAAELTVPPSLPPARAGARATSPLQGEAKGTSRFAEIVLPASGVVIGVALILGPFIATMVRSLIYWDDAGPALSGANFSALFSDPRFYQAVGNTVICGLGATAISCVLGFGLAFIVSRTDMPGRRWFEVFNLVPFFLSPYVGAISWVYLAAPHSGILSRLLNELFGLPADLIPIYGIGGATFVLSLFYTPYVYLFLIAPMRQMDPALEDAARVHGAGFWMTLRLVTVPLLFPALMSAALIVFVTSAGLLRRPARAGVAAGRPHHADRDFRSRAISLRPRSGRGVRRRGDGGDDPDYRAATSLHGSPPLRDGERQGLSAAHHCPAARRARSRARAGAALRRLRRGAAGHGAPDGVVLVDLDRQAHRGDDDDA